MPGSAADLVTWQLQHLAAQSASITAGIIRLEEVKDTVLVLDLAQRCVGFCALRAIHGMTQDFSLAWLA